MLTCIRFDVISNKLNNVDFENSSALIFKAVNIDRHTLHYKKTLCSPQ